MKKGFLIVLGIFMFTLFVGFLCAWGSSGFDDYSQTTKEVPNILSNSATLIGDFEGYEVYLRPISNEFGLIGYCVEYRPTGRGIRISAEDYVNGFRVVTLEVK